MRTGSAGVMAELKCDADASLAAEIRGEPTALGTSGWQAWGWGPGTAMDMHQKTELNEE